MKTKIIIMVTAVLLVGCAGQRHAVLEIGNDGSITHDDRNISLLQRSIGPTELAIAYSIKKDADAKTAMIEALMKSQASGETAKKPYNYIFALINNDPGLAVYIDHPEISGEKVIARPGGKPEFIFLRDIPIKIFYRRLSDGRIFKEYAPRYDSEFAEKISHKKKIDGVLVDFVLRVNQVS